MTDLIERMAHAVNERWFGEIDGARDMVRAALKAAEEAGFVLVPKEPTKEMVDAGWRLQYSECSPSNPMLKPSLGEIYQAMLGVR